MLTLKWRPLNFLSVYARLFGIGLLINFLILLTLKKTAIPQILNGEHLLLCSPTGSGKTLTAFLSIIDDLVRRSLDGSLTNDVQCIYISPIKALANDIQKNLIGPLTEIKERFLPNRAKDIKVGLRTGDTPQKKGKGCLNTLLTY